MTNFTFHTIANTEGERKELLQGIEKGYGYIPNLFGYMAEAPVTVQAYMQMNELLGKSSIPDAQQHVALLTVSKENNCDFCITAHRAYGKHFGSNQQSLDALHNGVEIEDKKDAAIANIIRSIMNNRGWVPEADLNAFFAAGFTQQQYFEMILVVTIKTLSNYSNHMTLPKANPEMEALL